MSTSTTVYVIPSATDASKAIVTPAEEALSKDDALRVEDALGLASLPSDDGASEVEDATETLRKAKERAALYARLRFDAVRLAYSTGRVGKGRMYSGQRDLAKAIGVTQARVSQILTAQSEAERVAQVKSTLRDAAKRGDVASIDGVSSTIHALAKDGTPEEVAAAVASLEAGALATGPVRTMDTDALVRAAETLLTLTGDVVTDATDLDAVRRVVAMLTTARANLSKALAPATV
jgi:hypothetical protein